MIHNVAVSNVNFVDKKPNGYAFVDFMGKKLFQTLRFLVNTDFTEISRNSNDEKTLVFCSKEYFESELASTDHTLLEITDDQLSLSFFRVNEYLTGIAEVPQNLGYVIGAGKTNGSFLVAKIVSTKGYTVGGVAVEPTVRGYLVTKEHFDGANEPE